MRLIFTDQERIVLARVDAMIGRYWLMRKLKKRKESRIVRVKPNILLKKNHAGIIRPSS